MCFVSLFLNNIFVTQPLQKQFRPCGKWVLFGPKGKSVTALIKKVGTNGGTGIFQSLRINFTSGKKAVVFGCDNQGWAEFIGNRKVLTQCLPLIHVGRVKQNRKVRFTADIIMLIDLLIGLNIKACTYPGRGCPPAEEPMTPIRLESMFHSETRERTIRTAR